MLKAIIYTRGLIVKPYLVSGADRAGPVKLSRTKPLRLKLSVNSQNYLSIKHYYQNIFTLWLSPSHQQKMAKMGKYRVAISHCRTAHAQNLSLPQTHNNLRRNAATVIRTNQRQPFDLQEHSETIAQPAAVATETTRQDNTTTFNSIHTYFRTQQDGKASDVLDMLATKTLCNACVSVPSSRLLPFLKSRGTTDCPPSTRCSLIRVLLPFLDQDPCSDPYSSDQARLV